MTTLWMIIANEFIFNILQFNSNNGFSSRLCLLSAMCEVNFCHFFENYYVSYNQRNMIRFKIFIKKQRNLLQIICNCQ